MVRKELGITSSLELGGASLCTNLGTTTELNAADYFRTNNMEYEIVAFEKADEAVAAYNTGRCDAYTTDQSALYAQRLKLTEPSAHVVLPEIISKEPLGPVVRQGDDQWGDIVRWAHFAMVNAEELGVTSKNVDKMKADKNPAIRRLLGVDGTFGENMGSAMIGPIISSARSAIIRKLSSAMSANPRRWALRVGLTHYGRKAACNMRRRFVNA